VIPAATATPSRSSSRASAGRVRGSLGEFGQLDWWVKERQQWLGRLTVQTHARSGSKPQIFARPEKAG
jgi:hypothetical protein